MASKIKINPSNRQMNVSFGQTNTSIIELVNEYFIPMRINGKMKQTK